MFIDKKKFNNEGFTFLEVLAAIFIISIGVVGIIKVMPLVISGNQENFSRLTAAYLAQEGIEIVRNVRDGNKWLQNEPAEYGLANCQNGCQADYYCLTVADPDTTNPPGHDCFGTYNGDVLRVDSSGFYSYDPAGTATPFKREITIIPEDDPITGSLADLNVTVDVSWTHNGQTSHFKAEEKLYNWQ